MRRSNSCWRRSVSYTHLDVYKRQILGRAEDVANPPAVGSVVGILLLPMLLIFLNTGLGTLAKSGAVSEETASQTWFQLCLLYTSRCV